MDPAVGLTAAAAAVDPVGALPHAASLADAAEKTGVIVAALLAGVAVLAPAARVRAMAMLAALVLTPVLLVGEIWSSPQFEPLRERPLVLGAGAAVVVVAALAGALVIRRRPAVFPVAAVAMLPFRVPIEAGGDTANLLVPLYFVIGAGALAFVIEAWRGPRSAPAAVPGESAAEEEPPARALRPGALEWLLMGFVALYAVQAAYSSDFAKALEQVVFFYVPFALLFALLVRVRWTKQVLATCLGVLVGLALLFTAVGVVEYATRTVFLNPKAVAANQLESYFRVSSLFFDPNIFGRFLVVVMLLVAGLLLWTRDRRLAIGSTLVLAALWGGVVLSLSQSSLAALLAGLFVLGALRWGTWKAVGVLGVLVAIGLVAVLGFGDTLRIDLDSRRSVSDATSGRSELVEGALDLTSSRPVLGWGAGAFETEFREQRNVSDERAVAASHTIPLTVAAEQGALGLLVYLLLLCACFGRLLRRARDAVPRAAIAAAFTALVVHTLLYAAWLEDPLTWTLLGVGAALAAVPGHRRRPEPELEFAARRASEPAAQPT